MAEIFAGKWLQLKPGSYIDEVRRSSDLISLIRVCQTGQQIASNFDIESLVGLSNLETRQYTITGPEEWNELANSCYTVRYKCEKHWQDQDAKNYSLVEWIGSEDYLRDKKVRPLEVKDGKLPDDIIVTAYDTEKDIRLIVSGLHRAAALTIRTRECDSAIPSVRIYECRGRNVGILFPCDFVHL